MEEDGREFPLTDISYQHRRFCQRRFPVFEGRRVLLISREFIDFVLRWLINGSARESPCTDRPIGDLARDHEAGGRVESRAARMGELLPSRNRQQSVSGARQLHSCAVAPVVARQAQGQATQGRDLSTLAPLRALRARTPEQAWARRVVDEGVRSYPRAGCGKSACPVR